MAEFSKLVLTKKGQALMAKLIAGTGSTYFTKISTSTTQYTLSQLENLTSLSNVKQSSAITSVERTNGVSVKAETAFSNIGVSTGYYIRALGLYAHDPNEGEILYGVTIETSGNCYMPAYNSVTVTAAYIQLYTTVGNAASVSLDVDSGAFATIADLQEFELKLTSMAEVNTLKIMQLDRDIDGLKGVIVPATLTNTLEYPFNDSKATVAISSNRNTTDYYVVPELVSASGGNGASVGELRVSNKLLNGFKLEFTGSATAVTVNCHVIGGM